MGDALEERIALNAALEARAATTIASAAERSVYNTDDQDDSEILRSALGAHPTPRPPFRRLVLKANESKGRLLPSSGAPWF